MPRLQSKEYVLHLWGGFFLKQNIKEHGYKPGYYFFNSLIELKLFHNKLLEIEKSNNKYRMLAHDILSNSKVRYETHAIIKLLYKNKVHDIDYNFGYGYSKKSARYMFYEGNYACDCNKSLIIQRKYKKFPELNCGDEIEMINFKIEYQNYTAENFVSAIL
jgi:hypothetical protein